MRIHREHHIPDPSRGESPDIDTLGQEPGEHGVSPHIKAACCGSDRPRHKSGGVLVTASASGSGFVTVHDCVTAIHPWLMRSRNDILEAMYCCGDVLGLDEMDLVVDLAWPEWLLIVEKSEWVESLRWRQRSWKVVHDLETSPTYRTY